MSIESQNSKNITYVATSHLKHIENFSRKRAEWLFNKIVEEQVWTKPLCIEKNHYLVMDGQHRMEVAKKMGLLYVPCLVFDYDEVDIWSLRDNYYVDHATVIERALQNNIYPYKTVKHKFPVEIPQLELPLKSLIQMKTENQSEGMISCV